MSSLQNKINHVCDTISIWKQLEFYCIKLFQIQAFHCFHIIFTFFNFANYFVQNIGNAVENDFEVDVLILSTAPFDLLITKVGVYMYVY